MTSGTTTPTANNVMMEIANDAGRARVASADLAGGASTLIVIGTRVLTRSEHFSVEQLPSERTLRIEDQRCMFADDGRIELRVIDQHDGQVAVR